MLACLAGRKQGLGRAEFEELGVSCRRQSTPVVAGKAAAKNTLLAPEKSHLLLTTVAVA
jgi:hypothetical protein